MDKSRSLEICCIVALYIFVVFCCLPEASSFCTWGPENFVKGRTGKLECDFKTPVGKVYWYKDNKPLANGTNGLYQSYGYQSYGQMTGAAVRGILHFPTVRIEHEGIFNCRADTSQNSSCPKGLTVEVSVFCKAGHITAANNTVSVEKFSNTSLRCSALSWSSCFFSPVILTWLYENRTLQNSTRHIIKQHKYGECRRRLLHAEFVLEISNVTDADAGKYVCQMDCRFFKSTENDSITLVTVQPAGDERVVIGSSQTSRPPALGNPTTSNVDV